MPELTVASTTDQQTDIDAAAGVIVDDKPKETPEGEEPETDKPASEAADGKEASGEKKESKSKTQKTIDKLTREKYESRKAIEKLEERLAAIENGGKPKAEDKPKADEPAPKPVPGDFPDYEAFAEALAEWKYNEQRRKERAAEVEANNKKAQEQAANAVITAYNQRVTEAMERYDDFEEVVGRSTLIPDAAVQAVVRLENGPDVAYYLGKNPKICKKMMDSAEAGDIISVLTEIGKISQAIMPTEEVEDEEGESVLVPKVTTRAKAPPRPVAGSSTRSSVPIDELPYADFRKIRDKQEKDRFRR